MKNKIECFISSLISTIKTHNGWWIDAHEYIEVGSVNFNNREYQVLMCKNCLHCSVAWKKL